MGLDDFKSEDSDSGKDISTRKKIKNVQMERRFWELMITTDPSWCSTAAAYTDDSSAKAIAQKMNEALEEGFEGHAIGDELADDIEYHKEQIIEDHIDN